MDKSGNLMPYFEPAINPNSAEIMGAIEQHSHKQDFRATFDDSLANLLILRQTY